MALIEFLRDPLELGAAMAISGLMLIVVGLIKGW